MNMLAQNNAQKTMSSREIADLCEARHNDVIATIDRLFEKGLLRESRKTMRQYTPANGGRPTMVYDLTKNDTLKVVSGYNDVVRSAIIDRWAELENYTQSVVPKLPQTFAEALQLAADQARQLELAAPKVQYFDKVVDRSTLLNATQVAQKLGMSAVAMNKLLDDLDVYSRNVKRARVFKQWFIDAGYGELKQTELGFSQPMFTTKGEAWAI